MTSLPPSAVDDQMVVGALRAGKGDGRRQAGDATELPVARDLNVVVAGGAVDDDAVGRAVADAAAGHAREVDRDLRDAGAGEVVDVISVGAAERVEVDVLDAVEVHRDVADVAGETYTPVAVGVMLIFSLTLAPLNTSVSMPALAIDRVAAVARIPDERVVAVAAEQAVSLPLPPVMMSLPSPPISLSLPSPPVMVSLPAPPSTVTLMSAASPLPAVKTSSPPLAC